MEFDVHDALEHVQNSSIPLKELPEIWPRFFIPPLQDKPQNPIVDTLKMMHASRDPEITAVQSSPQPAEISEPEKPAILEIIDDFWMQAACESQQPSVSRDLRCPVMLFKT